MISLTDFNVTPKEVFVHYLEPILKDFCDRLGIQTEHLSNLTTTKTVEPEVENLEDLYVFNAPVVKKRIRCCCLHGTITAALTCFHVQAAIASPHVAVTTCYYEVH